MLDVRIGPRVSPHLWKKTSSCEELAFRMLKSLPKPYTPAVLRCRSDRRLEMKALPLQCHWRSKGHVSYDETQGPGA
jgi:hypothetical protein